MVGINQPWFIPGVIVPQDPIIVSPEIRDNLLELVSSEEALEKVLTYYPAIRSRTKESTPHTVSLYNLRNNMDYDSLFKQYMTQVYNKQAYEFKFVY